MVLLNIATTKRLIKDSPSAHLRMRLFHSFKIPRHRATWTSRLAQYEKFYVFLAALAIASGALAAHEVIQHCQDWF